MEPIRRETELHANLADPAGGALSAVEARRLAALSPAELIAWAAERWQDEVAIVTSFQADGMVLLDLASRLRLGLRVMTLDTGRLPEESYELMDTVRQRYGVDIEVILPDHREVEELVAKGGPNLFRQSIELRLECCRVRKVAPLRRALAGLGAWIVGLRRDQTAERSALEPVAWDREHGLVKLSPLAAWSWRQVWDYVDEHDVPVHPLYHRGYTSIGCAPCTRPTHPGEASRAGRWWWESSLHKECGLHLALPASGAAEDDEQPERQRIAS